MALRSQAARVAAIGVGLLASSSCSGGSGAPQTNAVRLVQNPWDASRLDVAIAQQLLTSQMGMTVTTIETDEYSMWPSFAEGTEDACLEVWPSGHASDIQSYVDPGKVTDGGLLGPTGKISWYIPTYLLNDNPQLATWQAYTDPTNTAPFETADTGTKGRFLSGDPTWTSYDQDIITNLKLNLQIDYAGTEDAELAELDAVYQRRGAILLYLWSPHAALAKYELTPVVLPPWTAACYATIPSNGVDCDYPPDPLFKIFWPGLQSSNPRAWQFLKSFSYTTEDQIALLNLVDNEGYSISAAAAWWITTYPSVWKPWIPAR